MLKRVIMSISVSFFLTVHLEAATVTSTQWLQKQSRPVFKRGYTLPLLITMVNNVPPVDTRLELAANWGYSVRLSRSTLETNLITACNNNPTKYRAAAQIGNLGNLAQSYPAGSYCKNPNGTDIGSTGAKYASPEMPDSAFIKTMVNAALDQIANATRGLTQPIAIIDNWTEYQATPSAIAYYCGNDPTLLAAKGSQTWQTYVSRRIAHYDSIMRAEIKRRYPTAFYTAYTYGGVIGRPQGDACWDWKYMKVTTDLPSPECYYNYFNSGFVGGSSLAPSTTPNMLTVRLTNFNNAQTGVSVEIAEGTPHFYGWLCAGYQRNITDYWGDPSQGMYADQTRWMGYLKMLYGVGMLGGTTTGEFGTVTYGTFDETSPPKWLDQMATLGQAHALFSWLEPILMNSDLLPGTKTVPWNSAWGPPYNLNLPCYEFLVNGASDFSNTRVVARKVKNDSTWLICAWAADNVEKNATVTIPILGQYTILARPCGTVKLVHKSGPIVTSEWYDSLGMTPSITAAALNDSIVAIQQVPIQVNKIKSEFQIQQIPNGVRFVVPRSMLDNVLITITNASGRLVSQFGLSDGGHTTSSLCWNTVSQSPGMYIAKVTSNKNTVVRTFVLSGACQ